MRELNDVESIVLRYVLQHHRCSITDIYRDVGVTRNFKDLKSLMSRMIKNGILWQNKVSLFKKVEYRYLILPPFGSLNSKDLLFIETDNLQVSIALLDPALASEGFFQKFREFQEQKEPQIKKYGIRKKILAYERELHESQWPIAEQIFRKFLIILMNESKIMKIEEKEDISNEPSYVQKSENRMRERLIFIRVFRDFVDWYPEYAKPEYQSIEKFTNICKILDALHDSQEYYLNWLRSRLRISLREIIDISEECYEKGLETVAEKRKISLEKISEIVGQMTDYFGEPDREKITRIHQKEKEHILITQVTEVHVDNFLTRWEKEKATQKLEKFPILRK